MQEIANWTCDIFISRALLLLLHSRVISYVSELVRYCGECWTECGEAGQGVSAELLDQANLWLSCTAITVARGVVHTFRVCLLETVKSSISMPR